MVGLQHPGGLQKKSPAEAALSHIQDEVHQLDHINEAPASGGGPRSITGVLGRWVHSRPLWGITNHKGDSG
jgi:hypothetical protein